MSHLSSCQGKRMIMGMANLTDICNTSFREHGASEQSGALSFYPTPTGPETPCL